MKLPEEKRGNLGDKLLLPKAGVKTSNDIIGDVEYSPCGCEALVDVKTGIAKIEHLCMKHRRFSQNVLQQMV